MNVAKIQMISGGKPVQQPQKRGDFAQIFPEIGGSVYSVRQEIDDCCADMGTFDSREPDEIMRYVSGWSARLVELKVRIRRIEDVHREWAHIREREIEPVIDELERQYTIASRLLTVRELDYKMSLGQP